MDSCIEEDFESFLNWVQTENPVPPNFTFEESYKQGKLMPFLRFTNREVSLANSYHTYKGFVPKPLLEVIRGERNLGGERLLKNCATRDMMHF